MSKVILTSTLTCPECGGTNTGQMPTDACDFFYECPHCGVVLRPKAGECCVWCSYGTHPCPPVQEGKGCC